MRRIMLTAVAGYSIVIPTVLIFNRKLHKYLLFICIMALSVNDAYMFLSTHNEPGMPVSSHDNETMSDFKSEKLSYDIKLT